MIIQHNIMALNSYNKLSNNNSMVQKNLEKLSSGYRINRAGDDAAGLAISEKMRAQITGLERAKLNAQDGISLVQTAEGALTEVHSMLNRLVELGTESANGIYQADDRQRIQDEVNQITEEIDRISLSTNFNGINLLDGSLSGAGSSNTTGGNTVTLEGKGFTATLKKDQSINGAVAGEYKMTVPIAATPADMKADDLAIYTVRYVNEAGVEQSIDIKTDKMSASGADAGEKLVAAIEAANIGLEDGSTATAANALQVASSTAGSKGAKLLGISLKSFGATGTETAVNGTEVVADTAVKAEDEYRSNVIKFDKNFEAGNTLTIGNKTYEFVDQANLKSVKAGHEAVILGTNGANAAEMNQATLDNLVETLNANGVHARVNTNPAANREIIIDNLKEISTNKGTISFTSTTPKVTAGEAEATRGAWKLTAGVGSNGTTEKLTINYLDEDGKEQTKVLTYTSANADGATNATAMKNAIMNDSDLRKIFTAGNNDSAGTATANLTIEANTKGSGGAKILSIISGDNTKTAIVEAVKTTSVGTDAGKGITVDSGVQVGDVVSIAGKNFEFVSKDGADRVGKGNIAVVLGTDENQTAENLNMALVNAGFTTSYTKGMNSLKVINTGAVAVGGGGGLTLQVGDTADAFNKVTVQVDDMSSKGLGIDNLKVTDQGIAAESIDKVKTAINKVSENRGRLGALQNRLEHTINNLATTTENMTAAESRIRDTDMAKEMMNFTKNNVLVQAAQAMLAQANQQPQQVLQLLR